MDIPSTTNAAQIDVGKLPVVPQVLLKLIEACHKADVSFDELGGIVKQDASLCSKLLAVGNSPLYAQWKSVDNINRLLVILGVETIKTIAITSAVQQFFSQFDADVGKRMGAFWKQSLSCACTMKSLARLTGYEFPDEAYVTGLLHNLGQLVYLRNYSSDYLEILEQSATDQELNRRERERYGATSAEVGAYLLEEWTGGSFVSDAILFQHEPAERIADTQPLIRLLNLAHKQSGGGLSEAQLLEDADRLYGLAQPMLDELQEKVRSQVLETARAYGIRIDSQEGRDLVQNVDDEQARLGLAGQVRGFAMIGSPGGDPEAVDENGLWKTLLTNLGILFGLRSAVAFRYSDAGEQLEGLFSTVRGLEQVTQVRIPLKSGRTLVSEALLKKKSISTFEDGLPEVASVLDQQLKRRLGEAGMLCLPLSDGESLHGVLVAGLDQEKWSGISMQKDLISQFLQASSRRLSSMRRQQREREELLEAERAQQLLKTRKMIHEANNPLGVIKNYLQVLSLKLSDDESTQNQLGVIRDEIDRVAGILLRMREPDEPQQTGDGSVDINRLVEDLFGLFSVSIFASRGINGRLKLDPDLVPIATNRNSLKQVLTNLMKNAAEAMADGGELIVSTRDNVNVDGASFVLISVADSGPGLSQDAMSRLFSPVATTKGKGHAGLGLTIVKNLVTDMDGSISCRNREQGGAEFVFLLPRTVEPKT